jgi:hypothetical protein
MTINLTPEQELQLKEMGISASRIQEQLNYFGKGFPFIKLAKPASINDGIIQMNDAKTKEFINQYNLLRKGKRVMKFVPASGAASRMFKSVYEFIEKNKNIDKPDLSGNKTFKDFFDHIEEFAFCKDLDQALRKKRSSVKQAIKDKKYVLILETLMNADGLNYGALPKGMLKFHQYKDSIRTAVEEHLVEAFLYANNDGQTYLHFTVSPEHRRDFEKLVNTVKPMYEKKYKISYNITYSEQKKSTDTIAVDMNNVPVPDNGKFVFRPGGHGSLLENLNDLDGDVIFIKNIDNIVPDHLKDETVKYKQALAGMLLGFQKNIFEYLQKLYSQTTISGEEMNKMVAFAKTINIHIPNHIRDLGESVRIKYLKDKFNRPMRICGMVKNEGEPGGGPFWVDKEGELSIQIVESSQIDMSDRIQQDVFNRATHFNPVDLVCCIKNFEEKKFNLLDYRDNDTGFIAKKSKDGKEIKQQELPGLWNGSMADWITLFVEVPITTFNPVKTVHDLLRKQHQM